MKKAFSKIKKPLIKKTLIKKPLLKKPLLKKALIKKPLMKKSLIKKKQVSASSSKIFIIGSNHSISKEVVNRAVFHKKLDSLVKQDVVRRINHKGEFVYVKGDKYKSFMKNAMKRQIKKHKQKLN